MGITVVGLGPGDGDYLTRQAWETLTNADKVWLRTAKHPAVADLPAELKTDSFDYLYESAEDFEEVYNTITLKLIELGSNGDVVYAVPGHPHVGESTVTRLQSAAKEQAIDLKFVAGLSFVEPCLTAAGVDGMDGLQIHDALEIATLLYPPVNGDNPLLIGQVYSRLVASDLKEVLMAVYPAEHPVVLMHGAGSADEKVEHIQLFEIDHSEETSYLTSLYVPPLAEKGDMSTFAEAIAMLRSPDGCPWDIKQTPQSMRDGFLEEMTEVIDALDREDWDNLQEELGDLLLHITMQAQMASEEEIFNLTDVIGGIYAKIIRRHPHVWGAKTVDGAEQVVLNWEEIKAAEKAAKGVPEPAFKSVFDGIQKALPALAQSQKIQKRVRKVGFDWEDIGGVYDKLLEEVQEVRTAETPEHVAEEVGDLLFVTVNLAKWLGVDAEIALREANLKFEKRFREVERLAHERQQILTEMEEAELIAIWNVAKANLKGS